MRNLGGALEGLGRWRLILPPVLLVTFLFGLFLLVTAGQSRLEAAHAELQRSEQRQGLLAVFLAQIVDAETAQRGFLITENENDLRPYQQATPQIDATLEQLLEAYQGDGEALDQIRSIRLSAVKKLGEMNASLDLFKRRGASAGMEVIRGGLDRSYMEQLRKNVTALRTREIRRRSEALNRWQESLRLGRWITDAGAAVNLLLVIVAMRLVYTDLRRRSRQATDLQDQKLHLEGQVQARTRELAALSTHLQDIAEQEKHALSRELHDELGGLLVAARMDLSWLQREVPTENPDIARRFKRIQDSLTAGVDLKRRVVEELRPTLLDNMGLFSALRWQVREACGSAGILSGEKYPEEEIDFTPQAAIAIFRTVQESLTNILKHSAATAVDIAAQIDAEDFVIRISDDGKGLPEERLKSPGSHGLASMRHRVTSLGGQWIIGNLAAGGTFIEARIPLTNMVKKTGT